MQGEFIGHWWRNMASDNFVNIDSVNDLLSDDSNVT